MELRSAKSPYHFGFQADVAISVFWEASQKMCFLDFVATVEGYSRSFWELQQSPFPRVVARLRTDLDHERKLVPICISKLAVSTTVQVLDLRKVWNSSELNCFLFIMCSDAPELTTKSRSSGLVELGAGITFASLGVYDVALSEFLSLKFFRQIPCCFAGESFLDQNEVSKVICPRILARKDYAHKRCTLWCNSSRWTLPFPNFTSVPGTMENLTVCFDPNFRGSRRIFFSDKNLEIYRNWSVSHHLSLTFCWAFPLPQHVHRNTSFRVCIIFLTCSFDTQEDASIYMTVCTTFVSAPFCQSFHLCCLLHRQPVPSNLVREKTIVLFVSDLSHCFPEAIVPWLKETAWVSFRRLSMWLPLKTLSHFPPTLGDWSFFHNFAQNPEVSSSHHLINMKFYWLQL